MNDFRRWTPTEEEYIRDHWRSQSDAEMAKALGRSEGAVRTKRRQLRCSPQKTWTPEDEEYAANGKAEGVHPASDKKSSALLRAAGVRGLQGTPDTNDRGGIHRAGV